MCLWKKLKLQAKRAGALCKLKSRDAHIFIIWNLRPIPSTASMRFKPGLLNSQIISTLRQLWKAEWKSNLLYFFMPFLPPDNIFSQELACPPASLLFSFSHGHLQIGLKFSLASRGRPETLGCLPAPLALIHLITHCLIFTSGVRVEVLPVHARKEQNFSSPGLFPSPHHPIPMLTLFESAFGVMWLK